MSAAWPRQPLATGKHVTPGVRAAAISSGRPIDAMTPAQRAELVEMGATLRRIRESRGKKLTELYDVAGPASSLEGIERGAARTRASRLRPWLAGLGVEAAEISTFLERFGDVIAPERADGRPYRPGPRPPATQSTPRILPPPPLEPHERAALGARLWRERVAAQLERRQLAERIGCRAVSIWLVEHGLRRPSAELARRWIEATGDRVSAAYLAVQFPGSIAPRPVGGRPQVNPNTHQRPPAAEKGAP